MSENHFNIEDILTTVGRRIRVPILAIAALGTLSACQTVGTAAGAVRPVQGNEALISVDDDKFRNAAERRLRFKDAWQTQEYVNFESRDIQSEMIYAAAKRFDYVTLEFPFTADDTLQQWKFLSTGIAETGRSRRVNIALFDVRYRTFKAAPWTNTCFGFTAEGPQKNDDPNSRPTEIVWGYFCDRFGRVLSDENIEDIIFGINIISGNASVKAKIANLAPAAANRGNVKFPLDLARYYQLKSSGG